MMTLHRDIEAVNMAADWKNRPLRGLQGSTAFSLVAMALALCVSAPALAEEQASDSQAGVADIVVTAQRREQNLQSPRSAAKILNVLT